MRASKTSALPPQQPTCDVDGCDGKVTLFVKTSTFEVVSTVISCEHSIEHHVKAAV